MPDDLDTPSLRRFARDLRRIREERDVSLAVIQEETQVHSSHLESFESGTLHEEERMNEIYLKAFVRAYAEAIGLPTETVVDHLESAISGSYDDQLADEFLDVPSTRDDSTDAGASEMDPPHGGGAIASDRSPPLEESSEDAEDPTDNSSQDSADEPTRHSASDESPPMPAEDSGAPGEEESSTEDELESPNEEENTSKHFSDLPDGRKVEDGSSPPQGRSLSSTRPSTPVSPFPESVWGFLWAHRTMILSVVGIVFVLAVGGVVGGYLVGDGSSPESTVEREPPENARPSDDGSSTTEAAADTAATEGQSAQAPPANITLGDTLHVTVRATSDVRELRVQQDENLRRPYWIEAGEARVFPFTERITLQNQLDSLQLLLEGHPYPTDRTDEQGRVVIHRDIAEQFADTLRGAPVSVPETPDTIWGDGPPVTSDTLSSEP